MTAKTTAKAKTIAKKVELTADQKLLALTAKSTDKAKIHLQEAMNEMEVIMKARRAAGKPVGRFVMIFKNIRYIKNRRIR